MAQLKTRRMLPGSPTAPIPEDSARGLSAVIPAFNMRYVEKAQFIERRRLLICFPVKCLISFQTLSAKDQDMRHSSSREPYPRSRPSQLYKRILMVALISNYPPFVHDIKVENSRNTQAKRKLSRTTKAFYRPTLLRSLCTRISTFLATSRK